MMAGGWECQLSAITFYCKAVDMADPEIVAIFEELDRELDSHRKLTANFQLFCEETIGNLAALKLLNDDSTEELVKNS